MKLHSVFSFSTVSLFLLAFVYSSPAAPPSACRASGGLYFSVSNCCSVKKSEYGTFWPDNCDDCERFSCTNGKVDRLTCEEEYLMDYSEELTKCVEQALQRKKEVVVAAVKYCETSCSEYIESTTRGCPSLKKDGHCGSICRGEKVYSLFSAGIYDEDGDGSLEHDRFQAIEEASKINREKCNALSKTRFVKSYIEKCKEEIEKKEKENDRTLLCKEDATKSNTGCDEYCKKRAETYYGEDSSQNLITAFSSAGHGEESPVSYKTLISDNSQLDSLVDEDMRELEQTIPKKGDKPKNISTVFSLRWECKKDKCQPYEEALKAALEEAVKTCADLQTEAHKCCHEPESCVGGGLAHALDGLGKLNMGLAAFKDREAQCKAVQQTQGMYGSMKGAMAAQCTNKANECSSQCSEKAQEVAKHFKDACNQDIHTKSTWKESEHTCDKEFFEEYTKAYNSSNNDKQIRIATVPEECKRTGKEANRRIQEMNTNLGGALLASVKECGEESGGDEWKVPTSDTPQATTTTPGTQAPGVPNPDVTLGGGGDDTKKENDPLLPPDFSIPRAANPFDTEPVLGEPGPDMGKGIKGGMKGMLGGSSGGGGGGGGLGSGGGGSPNRGYGGGSGGGKKKKILLGYKGGKFAGYGGGGSSGESRSERGRKSFRGKKDKRGVAALDLKKLLPKGKQLNHKIGKYGSPHDNIFHRLSDRFQWMCRTNKISCK